VPATSLHAHIADLAADLAASVVAAIRGASLLEILGEPTGGPPRRGLGRPRGSSNKTSNGERTAPTRKKGGRLRRRSLEEITKALENVVALVKTKKEGLRAEQIRAELTMEKKELPRVLKEGIAKKLLKTTGRKRATTYLAA
jgi:hypothetical protein